MAAPGFFVMGSGRSGTSILQSILSMHPGLVVSHELRVLELALLVGALLDNHGDPAIDERAPKSEQGLALGRRYVELLAAQQLRAAGKPQALYADKYPPYCDTISHLDRLWPQARFVHILRDGRDVVASALQAFVVDRGWRRSSETPPVEVLAAQWVRQVRTAREYGAKLPHERYHELRYEELTGDAPRVLADVVRFVGLDPAANHAAMAARMRPGKNWHETLSPDELARFESVAGAAELLAELGYAATPAGSSERPTARRWADEGDAALARGDAKRAKLAYLRALRGKDKDRRGAFGLLAMPDTAESLFAALNARAWNDPATHAALAAWLEARGLDRAAARGVMGLEPGP